MEELSTGLAIDGSQQYGSNTGDRRNSLFAILQQLPRFFLHVYKLTAIWILRRDACSRAHIHCVRAVCAGGAVFHESSRIGFTSEVEWSCFASKAYCWDRNSISSGFLSFLLFEDRCNSLGRGTLPDYDAKCPWRGSALARY
jgi:hypothetical protein